ncbi:hypothetical protein [Methylobacterium oryzae]|uniref:hypothetical protein n=1 Tax=Methylobacterium oryzae TaxID=334852 RepID=UPI002F35E514
MKNSAIAIKDMIIAIMAIRRFIRSRYTIANIRAKEARHLSNNTLSERRVNDQRMISRVIHLFKSGRKRNNASEGRFEKRTAFYRPDPHVPTANSAPRKRTLFGHLATNLATATSRSAAADIRRSSQQGQLWFGLTYNDLSHAGCFSRRLRNCAAYAKKLSSTLE